MISLPKCPRIRIKASENPPQYPEACADHCSDPLLAPVDSPFIRFGPGAEQSNIDGHRVAEAMSCIAPQGVNGCGYESPLEAMLQALHPDASWNQGARPFLRPGADLAIVMLSDEADCSVKGPDGYEYFTNAEMDEYWNTDPGSEGKRRASSAICWNAGVKCEDSGVDGVYASCTSTDNPVLHPLSRYQNRLQELRNKEHKEIVMLGIWGVPLVRKHADRPPFEPIEGGLQDLVYHDWTVDEAGSADVAAQKMFEFGIGPGCLREADGSIAAPPVRSREMCEWLDKDNAPDEATHCCVESICADDFSPAMRCLSGLVETLPEAQRARGTSLQQRG